MAHRILKAVAALMMLTSLAACAQSGTPAQGVNVETAYYTVPVPPYTRSIFNTTNF